MKGNLNKQNAMRVLNCNQAKHTSIRKIRFNTSLLATDLASITNLRVRQMPTSSGDLYAHIEKDEVNEP